MGVVIGMPGGGLEPGRAGWAVSERVAEVGRSGELATADVLDPLTRAWRGPTVLHDLGVPASAANIDHVVVAGRRVVVVDSKVWRPGRYTMRSGHPMRDGVAFPHAGLGSTVFGARRLSAWLEARLGPGRARIARPVVAVWPSTPGARIDLSRLRPDGVTLIGADRLARTVAARIRWAGPADPAIVSALCDLTPGGPAHH